MERVAELTRERWQGHRTAARVPASGPDEEQRHQQQKSHDY